MNSNNALHPVSIEISLYPLQQDYTEIIEAFLEDINQFDGLDIRTSNMSTRIFGEYDHVMACLNAAMKRSMQNYGKMVFVSKIVNGDTREIRHYD